jgi:thymidine phosphorylase
VTGVQTCALPISGYRVEPDIERFRRTVREAGCAIIGQTHEVAPADRRLYAIRDVTATVESIPLITASILSKKLAAGLHGLVMDVKTGSGAFMATKAGARDLAGSLVSVATGAGLPTTALITDMDAPLADTAGNALEVRYALDYLTGARREARMHEIVLALGAEMLLLGRLAPDLDLARAKIASAIAGGAAAERFGRIAAALGGPADLVEKPERHLAAAPLVAAVPPERPGIVTGVDTRELGLAVVALGGGRSRADQNIDPAVGLSQMAGIGSWVGPDRPLALVHARDEAGFAAAQARIRAACRIGEHAVSAPPVVQERITA